jgi:hypothetical protein
MNFGELFKLLNSPYCEEQFYSNLTHDNKYEIIEKMVNTESFMENIKQFVTDESVIYNKIGVKIDQLLKKKPKPVQEKPVQEKPVQKIIIDNKELSQDSGEQSSEVNKNYDEEKGEHIGSDIYLKREEHLIKITTPNFSFYY